MTFNSYCVESAFPIVGPLTLGMHATSIHLEDLSLAITIAAKSGTEPFGKEIRVVHLQTGEVVFRKTAATHGASGELARRIDDL